MSKFIGQPSKVILYLSLGGTPVPAIPFTSISVQYCRANDTAFSTKILASTDWVEIGNGFYFLNFSPLEMSQLGPFVFTVTGQSFDNFKFGEFDVGPVPLPLLAPPNTCIVAGNIVDIAGTPAKGQNIIFRPVDFPMAENNSLIVADAVRTTPDVLGNFQVMLVQGKTVIVQIERTGLNFQITVPYAPSATLLSLLPPIPN